MQRLEAEKIFIRFFTRVGKWRVLRLRVDLRPGTEGDRLSLYERSQMENGGFYEGCPYGDRALFAGGSGGRYVVCVGAGGAGSGYRALVSGG